MLSLAWLGTPTWAGGRLVVTFVLGLVTLTLLRLALPRRRTVLIPPDSELHWDDGLETDDPFGLTLVTSTERRSLGSSDDPAELLEQARQIARATGARLVMPAALSELCTPRSEAPRAVSIGSTLTVLGTAWNAQPRVAQAALSASAFIFVVFVVSARAESGLSALSVALPLASVAAALLVGAALVSYRLQLSLEPGGIKADQTCFGLRRRVLELPVDRLLSVRVVGHSRFASTHLLFETSEGFQAISISEEAALRAVAHCHAAGDARDRQVVHAEHLETSGAIP